MSIDAAYSGGALCISLNGELDHHAAKMTLDAITSAIDQRLPVSCVLDFAKVGFTDSSGIAVILRTQKKMRELEGTFRVDNVNPQPLKVFNAAGVSKLVDITQREDNKVQ